MIDVYNYLFLLHFATTVSFSKSTYSIDEDSGPLYPVLVLSAITNTSITVRVLSISVSASGKFNIKI